MGLKKVCVLLACAAIRHMLLLSSQRENNTESTMKYRHKMKLQEAAKVKGQKRRVADRSEKPQYTDEEVAKLVDYDYGCLLDMIYYKLESMRDFFLSKHTHCADAKKFAKQM